MDWRFVQPRLIGTSSYIEARHRSTYHFWGVCSWRQRCQLGMWLDLILLLCYYYWILNIKLIIQQLLVATSSYQHSSLPQLLVINCQNAELFYSQILNNYLNKCGIHVGPLILLSNMSTHGVKCNMKRLQVTKHMTWWVQLDHSPQTVSRQYANPNPQTMRQRKHIMQVTHHGRTIMYQ